MGSGTMPYEEVIAAEYWSAVRQISTSAAIRFRNTMTA